MSVRRVDTSARVYSLVWENDDLVDIVGGWRRWNADGTVTDARISHGYPFDQALVSPSGRYQVVYAERGTKALVLGGGTLMREINRSYYHADAYDYPVALGALPDGREILVHCPDHYNVVEIDDLESGQRLTPEPRSPVDVFHSRLSASPDGRHLLMAGWLWHPYGVGWVFNLERAIADPAELDGRGIVPLYEAVDAEVESACWLDADRVVMATTTEEALDGDEADALAPGQVGVWSIAAARWLHRSTIGYRIGTMIACGDRVIALYAYPRLVDPASGAVIAEWPDVDAGVKSGCFGVTHVPTPVVALHPDGTRLAIAQPDGIAIIELPDP